MVGGGAARQQVLDAAVQDGLGQDLQLAQLADELDVAEHLALGEVAPLLLLGRERALLEGGEGLRAVLELGAALVEQQQPERAGLRRGLQVGRLLRQPLAQLRVHAGVLGLVQRLLEDQQDHALQHLVRVQLQPQQVIAQLLELFRCEFVEDAADLRNERSISGLTGEGLGT